MTEPNPVQPPSPAAQPAPAGPAAWTPPAPRLHLILLLLTAFALLVAGLQRTLPLLPDPDEATFAEAAVRIAATGNLDPGFYGHPGSTLIYPLAVAYRIWHALSAHGRLLHADPLLIDHYWRNFDEYYLLGRLLSVGAGVVALALLVLVGRRAWGAWRVGLAAGWLLALNPVIVYYAKMVRTDTVGMAFGLLAVYLALRILEFPTWREHLLAGAAAALAAAGRYFVGVVALLVLAANLLALPRSRRAWALLAGSAAAALAVFALANPAMVTNVGEVLTDLRTEARATHLGADGLSPLGNLWWYASAALPQTVGMALAAALLGVATTAVEQRRGADRRGAWLLLLYLAAFVAVISLSALHWARWLIPVLPVVLLFAGAGITFATAALARRMGWSRGEDRFVFALLLAALLATNGVTLVRRTIQDAGENTRLLARAWMIETLPAGALLLQEAYGAPLQETPLQSETIRALVDVIPEPFRAAADLQPLRDRGYDYVVVSSAIYDRFLAEAERYPAEVAFYERLFAQGNLVREFAPAWNQSGPVLRIYQP